MIAMRLGLYIPRPTAATTKNEMGFTAYFKTKVENTSSTYLPLKQITFAVAHTNNFTATTATSM